MRRGVIHRQLGQYNEAVADLEKALKLRNIYTIFKALTLTNTFTIYILKRHLCWLLYTLYICIEKTLTFAYIYIIYIIYIKKGTYVDEGGGPGR